MNFLAQISILLTVLSFGESADDPGTLLTRKEERSLCRPRISCRGKYGRTVCASDGKNYRGLCELLRARCTTGRNIKFVKYGRCPTCKVKGPVQCFVPACFRPRCPAYPKATCVSFCACQSEYYYKGRKVNCYPTTPTNPCNFKICGNGGICKVVKGKAVCVSQGAVCSLPKVVGTCRARFPRYFFNSVTQQCEHFHYGGCRGNRNRFKTKELCEKACKPDQDVCALPAVQGPCEGHMPRYFHNATSSRCEKFYYGGCGGNKNNFRTIYECKRKCRRSGNPCALVFCGVNGKCKVVNGKPICISSDVCSLPKKVGLCKALIPRYYFNTRTKRCEKFFYGGCGGNGNNFETLSQCNGKCAPKDPCAVVKCEANKECKVILGKARCTPILVNPCIATLCNVGTKCVVVNGKPKCIPVKPTVHPLCAAVLCLKGTCIVRNGRPSCVTSCSSLNRRCPQQGAFCNVSGGICVCRRFCRSRHRPVCGSDGRRYANKCQLDAAACRGRKRIRSVPCYVP